MSEADRLDQYALDWDSIVQQLIRDCEDEMDAAFAGDARERYRFASRVRDALNAARQTMVLDRVP